MRFPGKAAIFQYKYCYNIMVLTRQKTMGNSPSDDFTGNYQTYFVVRVVTKLSDIPVLRGIIKMPVLRVGLNNTILWFVIKTSTRVGSGRLGRVFGANKKT